jgi:hypothetical protein
MSEHAPAAPAPPAPAPVAAPAPAAPDVAPFLAVAEPEHVIALQRTAGNRAVTGLLQRTKKGATAPEPITAADVVATGGTPTVSGAAHADLTNVGTGFTRVFGATMDVTATVALATGVDVETALTVGYIQNMAKGDRIAVYTEDGTPGAKVVAQKHVSVLPGTRDAAAHFKQDKSKNLARDPSGNPIVEADTEPPWFASPGVFLPGGSRSETVSTSDTPSFPIALEVERPGDAGTVKKGLLAAVRGTDAFEIALAIKDGANPPINLAASTWAVDWAMTIDPIAHTGTGKAGAPAQPMANIAAVKPGTGLTHDDQLAWFAPVDDADADRMSLPAQLRSLPAAREYDPTVYHRIVGAIHRRQNPLAWHAHVFVDEDDSVFGSDSIIVGMEGVRGRKELPAQTAGTGEDFIVEWRLYDLFDPHDITAGSRIKVTVARVGQKAQDRVWTFPWGETEARRHTFPSASKYRMSMSLH